MNVGGYSHPTATQIARGILAGLVLQSSLGSPVHVGRPGASALANKGNYSRRIALMAALGVTDLFCDLGINDMTSSSGAVALKNDLTALFNALRTGLPGVRIFQSTITPATSAATPTTDSNQTNFSSMTDGRRLTFNADLRAGGLGSLINGVVEFALPAQLVADPNLWKAGFTSDGNGTLATQLHPNQTGGDAIVASAAAHSPFPFAA